MTDNFNSFNFSKIKSFKEFAHQADYSLLNSLKADPKSSSEGFDYEPREVFSGHYVPVKPKPLISPKYISHSQKFFDEIGLSNNLLEDNDFCEFFTGKNKANSKNINNFGWATGYALSIYGTEYKNQCPFRTGNGYGDGRAISIFEGIFKGKRWEMQLKGSGPTPYCRGGDGRAVLRSSIREFLVQELMHSLGVPTTRSLTLFVSEEETVMRPWYLKESKSLDPEIMLENFVAITTRVAPSFLRIGQIELFSRRVRDNKNNVSIEELKVIVEHLIERNYNEEIDDNKPLQEKIIEVAYLYRNRLTALVANWIRVGYCQGNFNSDNCALGGYTLDYGPFGFCEMFDPMFQPWTGGGNHFSFFNQTKAAELNFKMFCSSLIPLIEGNKKLLDNLDEIVYGFSKCMDQEMRLMWKKKLGLQVYDENLLNNLFELMIITKVDFTKFFRKLSKIPIHVEFLKDSFYQNCSQDLESRWNSWLNSWLNFIDKGNNYKDASKSMLRVNPKYIWREWLIVPAYEKAEEGDFSLVRELQNVFNDPYDNKCNDIDKKFDNLRPNKYSYVGGITHYSCSS